MIGYFERYMNTYINGSSDEDDHTSRRFKLMLVVVRNETFSFAFFLFRYCLELFTHP